MAAARAMLDEIHPSLPTSLNDQNTNVLGRLHAHNVYGTTSAATVASQMLSTFQSIRFGLMVGIRGGVPTNKFDIRLGDVVVSKPTGGFGGVVQYDSGKAVGEGVFERTGSLNKPPQILLIAIAKLQADQILLESRVLEYLSEMIAMHPGMQAEYGEEQDRLFDAAYDHCGSENTCETSSRPT